MGRIRGCRVGAFLLAVAMAVASIGIFAGNASTL